MKSNIEIKAKITDVQGIEKRVQDICKTDPSILHQKDIYYKSKSGRLKLRIFSDNEGELIYYERENVE
jgi:adenylate cyclase class IV